MRLETQRSFFGDRVCTYRFEPHQDSDARLLPLELAEIPIRIVRAFLVAAVDGSARGGHGHRWGSQLLVRIAGEIELELAFKGDTAHLVLGEHTNGVLVHAPVWCRQTYRGESPQMMVFCDTPYDPDSYVYERPTA